MAFFFMYVSNYKSVPLSASLLLNIWFPPETGEMEESQSL